MAVQYASLRLTIAAGRTSKVPIRGNLFEIFTNSSVINPNVSIEGGPFNEIPTGIVVKGESFNYLDFLNPGAITMSLFVGVSDGDINDTRSIIVDPIPIIDISNEISTPAASKALDLSGWLIDVAAAVNKGGGLVGIPVTGQPFVAAESVTITGTVNYNGTFAVNAASSANEVVITAAYVAETFDGVDDKIKPAAPRSIAAMSTRKDLIIANHSIMKRIYIGDVNINPAVNRGIPIPPDSAISLTNTGQIYYAAESGTGVEGCIISWSNLIKT